MAPHIAPSRTFEDEEERITAPSSPTYQRASLPDVEDEQLDLKGSESMALLQESARIDQEETTKEGRSTKWTRHSTKRWPISVAIHSIACFLMALALVLVTFGSFWTKPYHSASLSGPADKILSNGTHDWQRTVLMLSIDGLRADYVQRNLTTHLHDISLKGIRAKYMKPIFPTLTFPNHWALMTGLHAESHGIIANDFYDPVSKKQFVYTDPKKSWDAYWWNGEPIWETALKAGMKTANLMWPGPPVTQGGRSPTYYVPFKNRTPMPWKHDKIMEWLDYPFEKRPRLITVYEPTVDQVGHRDGPFAETLNQALREVDLFAKSIHQSLAARNLSHIVDVIFVSDHGMTDTSDLRLIYMDDILGDGFTQIEHQDGWPSMGIRFSKDTNVTEMVERLSNAAGDYQPPAFDVYTHETMPERYHFSHNPRIAPVFVVPKLGWALTNRHEHLTIMNGTYEPRGNHGYDNEEPSMRATFIADGPFATDVKLKSNAAQSLEPVVIDGFPNSEIYGLVAKLLGLTPAKNNGTAGFWDKWVEES
ncbi:hypothetical protein FRC03_004512 [Tulasnella sp. 419]|nr:hypothetical protein FRC03_004512 [Tulasnella sp. 419]